MSGSRERPKTDPMPLAKPAQADVPSVDATKPRMRTDPMLFQASGALGATPMKRDTLRDAAPPVHAPGVPSGDDLPLSSDRTPPMGGPLLELSPAPVAVTPFGPPVRLTPRGLGPIEPTARLEAESPDADFLARALDADGAARKKKDFLSSSGENARLRAAVIALDASNAGAAKPAQAELDGDPSAALANVHSLGDAAPAAAPSGGGGDGAAVLAAATEGNAVAVASKKKPIPESDRKEFATADVAPRPVAEAPGAKVDVSRADPRHAATQRALRTPPRPEAVEITDGADEGRGARRSVAVGVALLAVGVVTLLAWRLLGARAGDGASPESGASSPAMAASARGPSVAVTSAPSSSPPVEAQGSSPPVEAKRSSTASAEPEASQRAPSPREPSASAKPSDSAAPSEFYGEKPTPKASPKKPTKDEFYP